MRRGSARPRAHRPRRLSGCHIAGRVYAGSLDGVLVQTIVVVAAVVSCLFWWFVSWRFERTRRAVVWLDLQRPPEPSRWPLVSLIVPACNEALTLRRAVASRLNDDYPNLEMVLIDDRSTDESGRLIDELASPDPRTATVHPP